MSAVVPAEMKQSRSAFGVIASARSRGRRRRRPAARARRPRMRTGRRTRGARSSRSRPPCTRGTSISPLAACARNASSVHDESEARKRCSGLHASGRRKGSPPAGRHRSPAGRRRWAGRSPVFPYQGDVVGERTGVGHRAANVAAIAGGVTRGVPKRRRVVTVLRLVVAGSRRRGGFQAARSNGRFAPPRAGAYVAPDRRRGRAGGWLASGVAPRAAASPRPRCSRPSPSGLARPARRGRAPAALRLLRRGAERPTWLLSARAAGLAPLAGAGGAGAAEPARDDAAGRGRRVLDAGRGGARRARARALPPGRRARAARRARARPRARGRGAAARRPRAGRSTALAGDGRRAGRVPRRGCRVCRDARAVAARAAAARRCACASCATSRTSERGRALEGARGRRSSSHLVDGTRGREGPRRTRSRSSRAWSPSADATARPGRPVPTRRRPRGAPRRRAARGARSSARVGAAVLAASAGATVAAAVSPEEAEALRLLRPHVDDRLLPAPVRSLPRIDRARLPAAAAATAGRSTTSAGWSTATACRSTSRPPAARPRRRAAAARRRARGSARTGCASATASTRALQGAWYRCCGGQIRKLVGLLLDSRRRASTATPPCAATATARRKVFCVTYRDTGVPC